MKKVLTIVGLGALACFALYYLLSPRIVDFWVGPGRYVSNQVLGVMAVDYFLMTVGVGFAHFVLASGRNPFMTTTVISGLLNLFGCCILPGTYGLLGIAVSSLLAGLATNYWFAPLEGCSLLRRLRRGGMADEALTR